MRREARSQGALPDAGQRDTLRDHERRGKGRNRFQGFMQLREVCASKGRETTEAIYNFLGSTMRVKGIDAG